MPAAPATSTPTSTSTPFAVTIKGSRQGVFKGEVMKKKEGAVAGLAFHYEVTAPIDAATGTASGKRQHHPIRITRLWDGASPQIFQALVTNELLTEVLLEFFRVDKKTGEQVVFYTIRLQSARICDIRQYKGVTEGKSDPLELEDVSFVFEKIQIENLLQKTVASDDWTS